MGVRGVSVDPRVPVDPVSTTEETRETLHGTRQLPTRGTVRVGTELLLKVRGETVGVQDIRGKTY